MGTTTIANHRRLSAALEDLIKVASLTSTSETQESDKDQIKILQEIRTTLETLSQTTVQSIRNQTLQAAISNAEINAFMCYSSYGKEKSTHIVQRVLLSFLNGHGFDLKWSHWIEGRNSKEDRDFKGFCDSLVNQISELVGKTPHVTQHVADGYYTLHYQ